MKTRIATNSSTRAPQNAPQHWHRISIALTAFAVSLISSCAGFNDTIQHDEIEISAPSVQKPVQVQKTEEVFKPGIVLEQNPTLADSPELGKPYRLDTCHVETKFPADEIEKLRMSQKNSWFADTFVVFVELEPLGKGDCFFFDDYQAGNDGEVYGTIRLSEWFRVRSPEKENGTYIIRGFNRHGRCIYYREWVRSEAVPDPRLMGSSHACMIKKRALPASFKIPKLRLPPTEE